MLGASTDASIGKRVSRLGLGDIKKLQELLTSKFGGAAEGCKISVELDYRELGGLSIALEDLHNIVETEKS